MEQTGGRPGKYYFTEDTTTTIAPPISPNSAEGAAKSQTVASHVRYGRASDVGASKKKAYDGALGAWGKCSASTYPWSGHT